MAEAVPWVAEIGERIADLMRPQALFLLGSAARGEVSYRRGADGRLEFFSDLEFLLVTERRPTAAQRRAVGRMIAEEEKRLANPNPLFHIDLAWRERRRLATLPPRLFTFEMKETARLLYGTLLLSEVPQVTLRTLDFANTREILYKRLWAILLYLPRRILTGGATERERRVMGYLLARNLLDIPTVLLPHEGRLVPTYRRRVALVRSRWSELAMAKTFPSDFPAWLERALELRQTLDFAALDLVAYYAQVIDALERAFLFLLRQMQGGVASIDDLLAGDSRFFNAWPRSRGEAYGWMRLWLTLGRQHGLSTAVRWALLPRKGVLTLGLLAMHRAALAHLRGEYEEAEKQLLVAYEYLKRLWPATPWIERGSFPERWLALRWEWGEFWRLFVRLGDPTYRERFRKVMEWEDGERNPDRLRG